MKNTFILLTVLFLTFVVFTGIFSQTASPVANGNASQFNDEPGDRIVLASAGLTQNTSALSIPIGEDYVLGPGDVLTIILEGKANLNYHVNPQKSGTGATETSPDEVIIGPTGQIVLPVVSTVTAGGNTVSQLKDKLQKIFSEYYRNFNLSVTVSKPRTMKIYVNGAVVNPGVHVVSGTATVIEALLAAGIDPTGSTRRVELRRKGTKTIIDAYSIIVQGYLDQNAVLEAGDTIYVPPVKQWIDITGEVTRPGKYEMLPETKIKDAIETAMDLKAAAIADKTSVQRMTAQGEAKVLHIDAKKACSDSKCDDNIELSNGDILRIPSLSEYMPMVRMNGEFVGKGVFQRMLGKEEEQIMNKTGVYLLAQGKTAAEVIRETGGVTPQADLKNAKIIRKSDGKNEEIALDLEKILMQNDDTADVTLKNGDTIVLPAIINRVHVFGAVVKPGAYPYTPNRKLVDYVSDAGGQTNTGRMSHVKVIRGDAVNPKIQTCDLTKGVKGNNKENPVLEPGDVVFVAERSFNGWRDAVSILTTFRLIQTLSN